MPYDNLHSEEFNRKYAFDGWLGIRYRSEATSFRLWAPTAVSVRIVLRRQEQRVLAMQSDSQHPGLWQLTLQGDFYLSEYRYLITFASGQVTESLDPYAVAVTANGVAAVILDPRTPSPPGWHEETRPTPLDTGAGSICEVHIRESTIRPTGGIRQRGKFLGLTEEQTRSHTGQVSGLSYLKSLGVSHVQLMPCSDFASVDETGDLSYNAQFNWGYDPQNFLVPEGSYASDPTDPRSRIVDFKKLVQTFHEQGLRVIMDIVFNHVYRLESSPLALTVPGYFFRYHTNGKPANSTGVGNETASEQPMFRKFMLDTLVFWTTVYHIDGFRFDLAGIHDCETMQAITQRLKTIDPHILLLGEGWVMGHHPAGVMPSDQRHAKYLSPLAFFNDEFRKALKGEDNNATPGFCNGGADLAHTEAIYRNILAQPKNATYATPSQSVIYSACHDGLTLYDKNCLIFGTHHPERLWRSQALALSVQAFAFGLPFYPAGQDMLRSKQGISNSYRTPDHISALDYDRQKTYPRLKKLFQELLQLRQEITPLRAKSYAEIKENSQLLVLEAGHLCYLLKDRDVFWLIAHNADFQDWQFTLPPYSGQVRLENFTVRSRNRQPFYLKGGESVNLSGQSSLVLQGYLEASSDMI